MKGVSLSIEIIVALVLGVIILVSILLVLGNFFGESSTEISREKALQTACQRWTAVQCGTPEAFSIKVKYEELGKATGPCSNVNDECSLADLCDLSGFDNPGCKKRCGCAE